VLVEHARNLAGIGDATHAEYGAPGTPIVTLLACSLQDSSIDVTFVAGSHLEQIYRARRATERTTCSYGLDPRQAHLADAFGMRVAATDQTGEVRAVERVDHPFFVGTLYQPQLTTAPGEPHPIWEAFVAAAVTPAVSHRPRV
jgi:CTP synthase (UTP-ammonia lyase)